jgi:2-polyprenyl-3-methyl-5-hydroxy-6-metoxy-1,4-benzoquinol methylase
VFRSVLRQVPGATLSVLDVGGGAGWQLNAARECDSRVTFTQVIDFDTGARDLAKGNGHEFFCGRIEDFESSRRFDLILLLNLIEHVQDPLAVLQKLRANLTPAGVILVKTPNYDSLDARLFRHRNWGGYHAPRHWVIFTRASFERLAHQAGLRIRSFKYTQGAPFWATSILFELARRGLIRVTKERPAVYHPLFAPLAGLAAGFDFIRQPFAKLSQMVLVLQRDDVT